MGLREPMTPRNHIPAAPGQSLLPPVAYRQIGSRYFLVFFSKEPDKGLIYTQFYLPSSSGISGKGLLSSFFNKQTVHDQVL